MSNDQHWHYRGYDIMVSDGAYLILKAEETVAELLTDATLRDAEYFIDNFIGEGV